MNNLYINREARKDFRGWTKQGLEFLLSLTSKNKKIQYKIKRIIEELKEI